MNRKRNRADEKLIQNNFNFIIEEQNQSNPEAW